MSSTNKTTYYELPQFVDNDIFNPLVDDNDAYSKIDTALHNIANAEGEDASEIVSIKSRLDSAEGDIDALEAQNGNSVLTTTAQTLSGAVNELDADTSALDGRLDIVEDDINNASTGLKVKVSALETQNGSEVLTTTAQTLSGAVNELDADVSALDGRLDIVEDDINNASTGLKVKVSALDKVVSIANRKINGNLLLDGFFATTHWFQGGCYIGDNKVVVYFNNGSSNTGLLNCYDLSDYSLVWSYQIEAYHGNNICYRAIDNCLYICACLASGADRTARDEIIVVDLDAPSVIKEVIHAPIGIYDLGYDASTDTFYGADASQKVYEFEGMFESVKREIVLDNASEKQYNYEPIGLVKDGIIYGYGYSDVISHVVGFDASTGEKVYYAEHNTILNGFRHIGEVEFITYDFDHERFIMGSVMNANRCGAKNKNLFMIYEAGLYKEVFEVDKLALPMSNSVNSEVANRKSIYVCSGTDALDPWVNSHGDTVKCAYDAVTWGIKNNCFVYIYFSTANNGDGEVGNINLESLNCYVTYARGTGQTNVTIDNIVGKGGSRVWFDGCIFAGHNSGGGGTDSNITVPAEADYSFGECVFEDFTPTSGLIGMHIWVANGGRANLRGSNTFNGTLPKYYQNTNVAEIDSLESDTATHNFTTNDYEDVGLTFTVPTEENWLCAVRNSHVGSTPIGTAITGSTAASVSETSASFIYEATAVHNTPTFILNAGTYKVWIKRATAYNGESCTLFHKNINFM